MKGGGNDRRLLTAVMEAIAELKEGHGSTQKRIIERVQDLLTTNNLSFKNPAAHIRKALMQGVQTGLIKHKGGKFKLGLDSKDYAIFKSFQKRKTRKELPVKELRRRRRRRRGRRRRRRRRSMDRSPDDVSASRSGSGTATETPEPTDRSRRRRRRRRRGRRRTAERKWSDTESGHEGSQNKEVRPSVSDENAEDQSKNERDRDKDRDRERDKDRDRNRSSDDEQCDEMKYPYEEDNDDPSCGHPQCLCNLNQEMKNK
ncbi:hypothetical protein NQ315_005845 [Exocentrus adspersus]|uniref:H15 domain-containing protein n=1 Tax=Exocentrus adspersus TaxID=1586481 RepID=A0AAV8VRF2_9CUCU|nr:hypothetical protein NQ315_005845 [Exocentrus adspersus]